MTLKCVNGHYTTSIKCCPYCKEINSHIWTSKEIKFIENNYNKIPSAQIAEHFGLSRNQIIGKAYRLGLTIKDKKLYNIKRGEMISRVRRPDRW